MVFFVKVFKHPVSDSILRLFKVHQYLPNLEIKLGMVSVLRVSGWFFDFLMCYYIEIYDPTLGSFSCSKYQLRPVKTGLQNFKILMDRRPDRGLRSASVLIICGPNRLRSGPVMVFFRLRERTSKHYAFLQKSHFSEGRRTSRSEFY